MKSTAFSRSDVTVMAAIVIGDISGAFADLGTFIPLVIGVVLVGNFDPMRVLACFGVFAIVTGLIHRRPVSVQSMKALAALAITGSLNAGNVSAGGILIGPFATGSWVPPGRLKQGSLEWLVMACRLRLKSH